ncbi:DUF998 domain-containing protein [Nocardia thraciensis]
MHLTDQAAPESPAPPRHLGPHPSGPGTVGVDPEPWAEPGEVARRTSRRLRHTIAGIAWTLAFAYLIVEFVTAFFWKTGYSFRHDTISDLGITACTPHACSPLHLLMNAAFVALGLLTIIGAIGFRDYIPHGRRQWSIVALAVVIGLSTAATGLFPSNNGIIVHGLAVMPAFVSRHIVLILLAIWLWKQRRLAAIWSALCASTGVTGAILLAIGIQVGISERLVFYPLPTWMAITGVALMLKPLRNMTPPRGIPPAGRGSRRERRRPSTM